MRMIKSIKVPLIVLLSVVLSGSLLFGWSGHGAFTFLVIANSRVELDFKVPIRPKDFSEARIYKTDGNLANFLEQDILGQNHRLIEGYLKSFFDFLNNPPVDGTVPAWQIVAFYSMFPDIGIDHVKGLSWIQDNLLGDGHGLRHGRVKVGPLEVFEADSSFLYFMDLSRSLLISGNLYWGLRFFGYALHYLQDITQPYHVRPGTVWELIAYPFDPKVRTLLRNAHTAGDRLLAYLILYERERLEAVIRESKPIFFDSHRQLILEAFMYSYYRFPKFHNMVKDTFGNVLFIRAPSVEEMASMRNNPKFKELVSYTLEIISTLSGLMKGLLVELETFLKQTRF
ncbi:hypothetical protein [Fervidobacterium thailandense]|uniref:Phospholipase n=1 Tax=Fervidobacterium thailandense TaxID=1008305 RepID=A0A1E3G161_9BACT|nr:hypothetical protein [Fervidobacterium thailandense]ODN29977.1 hypothetical protein A4H02_07830 [Fervidobacterium thailandense]